AVDVGRVEEVHAALADTLLGRGLAHQHLGAIGDADAFLHDVVAGAGPHVVTVGPDAQARVIGELRPRELVLVVAPERIGRGADGVTHGVRRREHRLDEHPAPGELVVAHDRVAMVDVAAGLAAAAEAGEDRLRRLRAQRHAGRRIHVALLRVDGDLPVHGLDDVVRTDGEAQVGGIAVARDPVEVVEQRERRFRPLRGLDDGRRLSARAGRAAAAATGGSAAAACPGGGRAAHPAPPGCARPGDAAHAGRPAAAANAADGADAADAAARRGAGADRAANAAGRAAARAR